MIDNVWTALCRSPWRILRLIPVGNKLEEYFPKQIYFCVLNAPFYEATSMSSCHGANIEYLSGPTRPSQQNQTLWEWYFIPLSHRMLIILSWTEQTFHFRMYLLNKPVNRCVKMPWDRRHGMGFARPELWAPGTNNWMEIAPWFYLTLDSMYGRGQRGLKKVFTITERHERSRPSIFACIY